MKLLAPAVAAAVLPVFDCSVADDAGAPATVTPEPSAFGRER